MNFILVSLIRVYLASPQVCCLHIIGINLSLPIFSPYVIHFASSTLHLVHFNELLMHTFSSPIIIYLFIFIFFLFKLIIYLHLVFFPPSSFYFKTTGYTFFSLHFPIYFSLVFFPDGQRKHGWTPLVGPLTNQARKEAVIPYN